ncbi:MAG: AmmeMemoRadiSam system protein B [candidate division WOR-3 bacterium]|nr:AmmeMemoRadiSam system protein B [candidate division WOR-3 bacterium]
MGKLKVIIFTILIGFSINCKGRAKMVREPVVAGSFYPADSSFLSSTIEQYLDKAKVEVRGKIMGLVSPHAGYPYSGTTAAYAYKALEGMDIGLVILLGPSHYAYINGFSIYDKGSWKTPLGEVKIDEDFASSLESHSELIDYYPEGHSREHSLEVELPFLQKVLNDFSIVPIVFNAEELSTCKILAKALSEELKKRKNWIIVSSSDLYHGYDYEKAKEVTDSVDGYIKQLNYKGLLEYDREMREVGACAACGASAIAVMMTTLKELGANKGILLHRTNSLDVTGKTSGYAVGYGTWAIVKTNAEKEKGEEKGKMHLSIADKEKLLSIARETINEYVRNGKIPEFSIQSEALKKKSGAFVTLKEYGQLRGCIGLIRGEEPLYSAVRDMAISAATRDPRFPQLRPSEIDDIEIEISVLTPLQKVKDASEIKVGRDGLMIQKGFRSGLLLPQVPVEQGWDRETFLEQTCYKAGLPPDAWKDAELWKFQAIVFSEQD